MLDMSLLKSPSFMLLAISGFLCMMGFFVPFMYVEKRGLELGLDPSIAGLLVPAIGIANTIARIVCGFLSSLESVDANLLSNIAITLGGVTTILSGLSVAAGVQITYTLIFGLGIGEFISPVIVKLFITLNFSMKCLFSPIIACFSALRSIIAVDLMGIEKLTNAFGILMMFQGLAAIIGGPIAGALYDATKSFDYSFYFAGGLITLSAILCYPIKIVNKYEKQRAQETSKVSPAV